MLVSGIKAKQYLRWLGGMQSFGIISRPARKNPFSIRHHRRSAAPGMQGTAMTSLSIHAQLARTSRSERALLKTSFSLIPCAPHPCGKISPFATPPERGGKPQTSRNQARTDKRGKEPFNFILKRGGAAGAHFCFLLCLQWYPSKSGLLNEHIVNISCQTTYARQVQTDDTQTHRETYRYKATTNLECPVPAQVRTNPQTYRENHG
jgi:hypothetical protein